MACLLKQLIKAVVERALQAEIESHLGHGKHAAVANPAGNTRNGVSHKTRKGEFGDLPIEIPVTAKVTLSSSSLPNINWTGFDDKILSLYARGKAVHEIQGHLQEIYGTKYLPA